ncbi:lipoprotein insertase outer membrane protein LolB [Aromatoleum buckelii]|uniref:lipoprotein insertase outer membrane protein LolB n=1 Tax=Aromatoleum buckelii TaxID=200254 RepID=UPI001FF1B405|nr:lipoprotein insertase outer membrane protein LolB [Aromatoleum buckelii]MCK0511965.1 lipoprotein insertase outer membrane protein LolB [Aromatoleum buckelii]
MAFTTAGLSGCAIQPAPPATTVAARAIASSFELEGRISATDGERAANGGLQWFHSPAVDEWTVLSPLGQIVGQLVTTAEGAQLRTADGRVEHSDDTAAMLHRLLGVAAPLDGLAYWVQATARPGARVLDTDERGRPARITDAGWTIEYVEYAGASAEALPRRIDAHWGDARIRLIIDQWTPLN